MATRRVLHAHLDPNESQQLLLINRLARRSTVIGDALPQLQETTVSRDSAQVCSGKADQKHEANAA